MTRFFEYDVEQVDIEEDQRKMLDIGMPNVEALTQKIKDIVNKRALMGWEPLYPFSVPLLWFRREVDGVVEQEIKNRVYADRESKPKPKSKPKKK